MSLYFVRHQHSPETCPAKDPDMGQMLLGHLSHANARKFGLDIQGEAVLDGRHTLVLIVEAEDPQYIARSKSCRPPPARRWSNVGGATRSRRSGRKL
jgi:hypothetical protein